MDSVGVITTYQGPEEYQLNRREENYAFVFVPWDQRAVSSGLLQPKCGGTEGSPC